MRKFSKKAYTKKSMDFLDPRKRRAHRRRLIIGYGLMAVAIGLGAVILVYSAYGYGINTKTGDVVQNGLLFVDSKPGGAEIYINGQDYHASSSARLILPAGNYSLELKKDGYRNWSRKFTLTEHSISRYVYPFLFPVKPNPSPLKSYPNQPNLVTESPDHHWLLAQSSSGSDGITFDEFDTTNLKQAATSVTLPGDAFGVPFGADSQLKMVEWSTDNKNVLLEHIYPSGHEFIVFNRASPSDSFNVNKVFNTNPTQVSLHNKKVDQLYLFDGSSGDLSLGNVSSAIVTPVLSQVLAFKPSGSNLIFYITAQDQPAGKVMSKIWDSGKSYSLYSFSAGQKYLLDFAQYQSDWYYGAGSNTSDRINIYKNPLDGLKNTAVAKALPMLSLRVTNPDTLSFSDNTRFLGVEGGQAFAVYDFETQTSYHYTLAKPISGDMDWMDGHRLVGESQGQVLVMDYDSTNQQLLVPTSSSDEIYFDAGYNHLFTIAPSASGFDLNNTDTRAGVDLPKQ